MWTFVESLLCVAPSIVPTALLSLDRLFIIHSNERFCLWNLSSLDIYSRFFFLRFASDDVILPPPPVTSLFTNDMILSILRLCSSSLILRRVLPRVTTLERFSINETSCAGCMVSIEPNAINSAISTLIASISDWLSVTSILSASSWTFSST